MNHVEEMLERLAGVSALPWRDEHRTALRTDLLLRYRARARKDQTRRRWTPRGLRALVASAALTVALLASWQVPARYTVAIGERLVFVATSPTALLPDGLALRAEVRAICLEDNARVWAIKDPNGITTIYIDCVGNDVNLEKLAGRLRQAWPGLAEAEMLIQPLEASVSGTLVDKLGHVLRLRPAPAVVDQLRRDYLRPPTGSMPIHASPPGGIQ